MAFGTKKIAPRVTVWRVSKANPELAEARRQVRELKLQLREAERAVLRVKKGGKL